jgi:hypothetical protein
MGSMGHVELTDQPCPECEALLEIRLQLAEKKVEPGTTVQVKRILTCPECGYAKVLER